MGLRNFKRSLDANHSSIVSALRSIGASVIEADKLGNNVCDLIATVSPDKTIAIEVKTETGKFFISQLRWLAEFKGYSAFVSSETEAIATVVSPHLYALNEKDKLNILRIVLKYEGASEAKKPQISVKKFDEEFNKLKGR